MGKIYCSHCGAELDGNSQFCQECGKSTEITVNNSTNNFDIQNIVDSILKRPKLIILTLLAIIVVFGVSLLFNSNPHSDLLTTGETYDTMVYGMPFHIPKGYEEDVRGEFTNGEFADFSKSAWTIEISVSTDSNFKKSQYVKSSFTKVVNGKQGTVYTYNHGHMAFVYFDNGYRVVIRDASFKELEEIII